MSDKSDNIKEKNTAAAKNRMLLALEKHLGIVDKARKAARVSRDSHYRWYKEDAEYAEQVDLILNGAIDHVENKLMDLINGVVLPDDKVFMYKGKPVVKKMKKVHAPDTKAVVFYLETKGKNRGWQKRTEISGPNGGAIEMLPSITIGGPPKKEDI